MENFYLLLPLIFKTQNRINSQILKHKENLKSELCNKQGFKLFHIWEDTENEDLHNVFEYLDNVC